MLYRSVDDFFKDVDLTIRRKMLSGALAAYPRYTKFTDRCGEFSFTVEYWDTSVLRVEGAVDILSPGEAIIHDYRYQYQRAGETVFRYDDARHFPRHPTFPHHKHIGPAEMAFPCYQPTLEEVLSEVEDILVGGQPWVPVVP